MQAIRKKKIESLLRETISATLLSGEVKDPRVSGLVTVTGVKVASDLRDAKVYISVMDAGEMREQIIGALNHASGYIQKILARRVRLKYTPRLTFHIAGRGWF